MISNDHFRGKKEALRPLMNWRNLTFTSESPNHKLNTIRQVSLFFFYFLFYKTRKQQQVEFSVSDTSTLRVKLFTGKALPM